MLSDQALEEHGQDGVDVVASMLAAFQRGDLPAVLDVMHPHLRVSPPAGVPYAGQRDGREAFAALLGEMAVLADIEMLSREVHGAGGVVAVELAMRFTGKASGTAVTTRTVEIYRVVDGQVREIDIYYKDSTAVAQALS